MPSPSSAYKVLCADIVVGNLTIVATAAVFNRLLFKIGTPLVAARPILGVLLLNNSLSVFTYFLLRHWAANASARNAQRVASSDEAIAGDVTAATDAAAAALTSERQSEPLSVDPTKKSLKLASRDELKRPNVAWPTILLAAVSFSLWAACVLGGSFGWVSAPLAFIGSVVMIFLSFTPMHDAVHNAVCPRKRWLNDAVGVLASLPFLGVFKLFKIIHLIHHRHTNDNDSAPDGSSLDPDNWAGEGAEWMLPFRWATVFFYYVAYLFRLATWQVDAGGAKPRLQSVYMRVYVMTTLMIRAMLTIGAGALGWSFFYFWIFPLLVASTYLMFVFDYLPHRPHIIPYKQDPYASTSVLCAVFDGFLTPFFLSQNYHNIHHMYPYIPFYNYGAIWRAHKDELIRRGTRVLPLYLFGGRARYLSELRGVEDFGGRGKLTQHVPSRSSSNSHHKAE